MSLPFPPSLSLSLSLSLSFLSFSLTLSPSNFSPFLSLSLPSQSLDELDDDDGGKKEEDVTQHNTVQNEAMTDPGDAHLLQVRVRVE